MYKTTIIAAIICLSQLVNAQNTIDYGKTKTQIQLLNLDCLHAKGFTGKDINIAHLDDGFDKISENRAFVYAREKGLFKANYDFVENTKTIAANGVGSHGLETVSVVNGYLPGEFVGAAFDANILLAHTEDNRTETKKELEYWRQAVDWAVENDVDIITSSLQYNNFDTGEGNFTYKDMDGKTTAITNAADYAASKGILVVAIQGNFGNDPWHYVTAPGDADSVLTVGAATLLGKKASLSSFGPSFDQRVKPDVLAVGEQTSIISPNGNIRQGNGTSYAGPAVAGLAACLMQAHPDRTNMEIIAAIRNSADHYQQPDVPGGYGYGIPDACKAHDILTQMDKHFAQTGEIKGKYLRYQQNKVDLELVVKWKKVRKVVLLSTIGQEIDQFTRGSEILGFAYRKRGHYIIRTFLKKGGFVDEHILMR